MTILKQKLLIILSFILLTTSINAQNPYPKRELRGAWIATVANIDWPSSKDLTSTAQQQEYINLLNEFQKDGINTVFTQIRPAADALYAKTKLTEPWSLWLTGQQGRMPYPYYDPLEFMIYECHSRAMEFHAWFNPYRATHKSANEVVSARHITKMKPEYFFTYDGQKIFDPGIPEVREYIVSIIMRVVRNYDIDGVHFDDYFYPYPSDSGVEIPDQKTFAKYNNGFTDIEEWRRNNVDLLIKMVNDSISSVKPHVKFGVSPFGIWQNKLTHEEGSETDGGSSYNTQYADTRKWIKEGWVDYMAPQIYFNIGHPLADFETITSWWDKNSYGRHIYVGIGSYKINSNMDWVNPSHMPEEVRITRKYSNIKGQIYYSAKSLMQNKLGFSDSLAYNLYKQPALPPTMEWKDNVMPNAPLTVVAIKTNPSVIKLTWDQPSEASDGQKPRGYVIYRSVEGENIDEKSSKNIIAIVYNKTYYYDSEMKEDQNYVYKVSSLDRMQNESKDLTKVSVVLQ